MAIYIKNQLSVIISVYNSEKYLERCLNSICNQTYSNLQIIIINDGSTDSSFSICQQYTKKDERIILINQANSGISYARNVGLKNATGEYVTFVDSDDFLDKNAYEIAISNIGSSDCLAFGYVEYYEKESHKKIIKPNVCGIVDSKTAIHECLLFLGYNVTVWNKIFKTCDVKNVNFDTNIFISEDELWLISVLLNMKQITLINEPLYYYVQTGNSLMRSKKRDKEKWDTAIIAKLEVLNMLENDLSNYELMKAKIFDDLFSYKCSLYITKEYEEFHQIDIITKKYESSFRKSKNYGIKRKTKYFLIDFLFKIKCPGVIVGKLANFTTYKAINRLS